MSSRKPNFTQVPNEFLDSAADFTPAQFMILMVICRQTYGWHKDSDRISISQFMSKSGLSNRGVLNALNYLQLNGYIVKTKTSKGNVWAVNSVHRTSEVSSHTKETIKIKRMG